MTDRPMTQAAPDGSPLSQMEEVTASFRSGTIAREEYWLAMARQHEQLKGYHSLLTGSGASMIEIDARELRVVTPDGLKFIWSPDDLRNAANVLVNYGRYETVETAFLSRVAADSRTVIDIGANVGWYAVHLTRAFNRPDARLHAFEPVPATFETLSRNVALNGFESKVRCNHLGLGAERGTLQMFVPMFHGSSAASLANLHPEDRSNKVEVQIDTFDHYCAENGVRDVDLIKCDVEGAELLVVQGAHATIARDRPVLFLELLRKWSKAFGYHPNEVIDLLSELDYECWSFGDGDQLVRIPRITDETVQTNFVFAQPGVLNA